MPNGYIIVSRHCRVKQAIKAGLEEIEVLVVDAANDNGAMRSIVENIAREPLNPVDQWRAIKRLEVSDARRLKALDDEDGKLKKHVSARQIHGEVCQILQRLTEVEQEPRGSGGSLAAPP